jgi:hypothetical protein
MQVDMELKLRSDTGNREFRASYHWGANDIESSQTRCDVQWVDRTSSASVHTSGVFTDTLNEYLETIEIETDQFSASADGSWSLSLQKKLCQGVFIALDVEGDNTTVDSISPSLSASILPSGLSSALESMGVEVLEVIGTISIRIPGKIVRQYFRNCYDVVMDCIDLAKRVSGILIGTINL